MGGGQYGLASMRFRSGSDRGSSEGKQKAFITPTSAAGDTLESDLGGIYSLLLYIQIKQMMGLRETGA